MLEIVLIPLGAAYNRLRGAGLDKWYTGKIAAALYMGAAFSLLTWSLHGIAVALGLMIWSANGWGKYFSAYDGLDKRDEKEIPWIDVLDDVIDNNYLLGTIQMTLRGLYILPLFIYLSCVTGVWYVLPLAFLQGLAYHLSRYWPTHKHIMAEIDHGIIIGCALWIYSLAI